VLLGVEALSEPSVEKQRLHALRVPPG
jgi:hypothetical protein